MVPEVTPRARFRLLVLVGACLLAVGQGAVASAPSTTALPFTRFSSLLVDDSLGRVLLTGGFGSDRIVVTDEFGAIVGSIGDEPGASGMAQDFATVYVALADIDAIDAIDPLTLTRLRRYLLPPGTRPFRLAISGGKVWFNSGTCGTDKVMIGSLDPLTGAVALNPPSFYLGTLTGPFYCPEFAVSSLLPDRLFAWDHGLSPPTVFVYDTTLPIPQVLFSRRIEGNIVDADISPDGASLLVATGGAIVSYRTSDLERETMRYAMGAHANAVSTAPGAAYIAGGCDCSTGGEDAYGFAPGGAGALVSHDLGYGRNLYTGAIAMSGDGARLYAVTGATYGLDPILHVLAGPNA